LSRFTQSSICDNQSPFEGGWGDVNLRYQHAIKYKKENNMRNILTTTILLIIFCLNLFSEDKVKITNVHYRYQDGKIIITYDLSGPKDKNYEVNISLKREDDSLYVQYPDIKLLTGKVGKGSFTGREQQIIWDIGKENLKNFTGVDYYFKVNARIAKPNNLLYWIGGGAAVLGGGAYLLLSGKKEVTPIPVKQGFTMPVGRPNN
jgi:hypothetical protein